MATFFVGHSFHSSACFWARADWTFLTCEATFKERIKPGELYAVLASAGDGKGRRPFLRAHLGAKNAHARLGAAARPLRVRLKLPRAKNGGMSSCSPAAIRRRLAKRAASKPN